mmetsp:Transcript_8239/g.16623  ORF Transcript_8239/g.16623 Transcript_8239/m.16623 type:complete len:372 (+) Transcript_8239:17-1132(+)
MAAAPGSLDSELRYLSDVAAREAELKRLNDEIDMELNLGGPSGEEDKEDAGVRRSISKKAGVMKKLYPGPATGGKVLGEVTNRKGYGQGRKGRGKVEVEEAVGDGEGGEVVDVPVVTDPPTSLDVPLSSPSPSVTSSSNPHVPLYSPSTEAPTEASPSPSQLNSPNPEIGTSAQLRFQKARIKNLTVQLQEQVNLKNIAEKSLNGMQRKFKAQNDELKRLQKSVADLTSSNTKLTGTYDRSKESVESYKREVSELKKELSRLNKEKSASEKEHRSREVRLARALEECDRFKATLSSATSETKGMGEDYKKEIDKSKAMVRALERQRGELLAAFKKQGRLVEVLKRQKVHTEAVKLLEFTEEEFVKVLDWGN